MSKIPPSPYHSPTVQASSIRLYGDLPFTALLRVGLARLAFGAPTLFAPVQRPSVAQPDGITVFANGVAPTVAYYFRSRFEGQGASFIDTSQALPSDFSEGELHALLRGRQIIIARNISPPWLKLLALHKAKAVSIAYFMDDDLPGAALDPHLLWAYARRRTSAFRKIRPLLAKICDTVLVSTPALAARYPEAKARVLPPLPLPDDDFTALDMTSHWNASFYTIFYHGAATHARELAFVADVARIVQTERADTIFEVFGKRESLMPFVKIPRVRKLHPMLWEDYLHHTRAAPMHIGLAPLMETSFNACRAAVKIYDITRCRAVGLYSDKPPFSTEIDNNCSGVLLPDNPQAWAEEILKLLHNPSGAWQMAINAAKFAPAKAWGKLK